MAIPRDPGGAPRRPQPRTRKRPVIAAPEIQRSAPPKPKLGPPRPVRRKGVFAQPIGRVPPVGNAPRRAAQRTRRAARALPAEHQLPRFPVLKRYTPKQRQIIRSRTEQAVRKVAKQRGVPGHKIVQTLFNEGDRHTRQTLQTYGRVVREQHDITHSKALGDLVKAKVTPNLNALTADERNQWRKFGTVRTPVSQEAKTLLARQSTQAKLRNALAGSRLGTGDRAGIYRILVASRLSQARSGPATPHGPGAVPLATVRFLKDPSRNLLVAAAPGLSALAKPGLADAVSLPKDVVDSTYYTAAALWEAAHGRPQRLHELGSSLKNHDPLVLAAQGRWHEALKATGQHPLDTVLEIGGLRGATLGLGKLARVSTERAPAVLPGTRLAVQRRFSHDIIGGPAQRRIEAARLRKSDKLYAQARDAEHRGDPQEEVDQRYAEAEAADPRLATTRQIQHRADVTEAVAQPLKRRGRAELKRTIAPHELGTNEGGHMQRLSIEGIAPIRRVGGEDVGPIDVRSFRRDLKDYRDSLVKREGGLKGKRLKQNRNLRHRIDEALKLKDDQLRKVAENSGQIARITNAQESRNIALGQLDPREALISKVKPYAVRHMGAEVRADTAKLEEWRKGGMEGPPPTDQLVQTKDRIYTPKSANARAAQLEAMAKEPGRMKGGMRAQLRAAAVRIRATRTETIYSPLRPEQVIEHMKAHGVNPDEVAFITQRPGGLGSGSFNMRAIARDLKRKGLSTQTRTGQAVMQGLLDTHPSRLTANVVRLQQLEAADTNYVRAFHEVAARHPDGELRIFTSPKKAEQFREGSKYDEQGNRIHGAPDWRIIRINPWGGRESQLQHLLDAGDAEGFMPAPGGGVDHPISRAIEDAVGGNALEGHGPWAAVPAVWADRIAAHADVYRNSSPTMRALTGLFRNTVLPLSLPWIFGNVSEAAIRTAIHNPRMARNLIFYHRVIKAIEAVDPEEAGRIKDMLGTGHFGMSETSNVYTSMEQFAHSNKPLRALAKSLAALRRTHGPKEVADAYGKYTEWVFHGVNQRFESPFREMEAGAHLRDVFGDRAIGRISARAVEDAAHGLRNTNAQVRMADEVRRAYGQYEAFAPWQRKFFVLYSPFAAWSFNAVRFLVDVLPRDHPVLTALLAAQNAATTDWRSKHGLVEGGFLGGKSPVPGFLQGSIPLAGGGHIRAQRYTPFGFFNDLGGSVSDLILPQFSGALHALQGQKWTGAPLKPHGEVSTPEKVWAAFTQELATFIPVYGRVQQAIGYQGSPLSRIWQTENPLKVVKKQTAQTKQRALPKGYKAPSADVHDYSGAYSSPSTGVGEFDYSGAYGR